MNDWTDDSIAPSSDATKVKPFTRRAAQLSLWLPIGGLIAQILFAGYGPDKNENELIGAGGISAFILFLLIIAGLVFGIIALCGVKRHGRKGILWPALIGTSISSFLAITLGCLLFSVLPLLYKQWEQKKQAAQRAERYNKALAEMNVAMKKLNDGSVQDSNSSELSTADAKINATAKILDDTAEKIDGDTAGVTRAYSADLKRQQLLLQACETAAEAFNKQGLLDMRNVKQKDELVAREKVAQDFIDSNKQMKDSMENGERYLREELVKQNVRPKRIEAVIQEIHTKMAIQRPLMVDLRETQVEMGEEKLQALTLLETNWGRWRYNDSNHKIMFSDNSEARRFTQLVAAINKNAAEAKRLTARLRAIPSNSENK